VRERALDPVIKRSEYDARHRPEADSGIEREALLSAQITEFIKGNFLCSGFSFSKFINYKKNIHY